MPRSELERALTLHVVKSNVRGEDSERRNSR
jgi:hypothetical protein